MSQNLFKIYDGRTNFWQWDTNQKLIVLDPTVDEVHFSHKDMTHAIPKDVCTDKDGKRICYIPDAMLTFAKNLVASAYVTDNNANVTLRSVKFAVTPRPIPSDYVVSQDFNFEDFTERLSILEDIIEDGCLVQRFDSIEEAENWAQETKKVGVVLSVKIGEEYQAHVIADDYRVIPVCDCDEDALIRAIAALQNLIGDSAVANQIEDAINNLDLPNTYDDKGSAEQALKSAKLYTDGKAKDYDAAGSAGLVQSNLNAEITRSKAEDAAISKTIDQLNSSLTSAKKDIESNKKDIDTLNGAANNVQIALDKEVARAKQEEDKIAKSVAQANSTITEIDSAVKSNKKAINLLNDGVNVKGSVDYKIAHAIADIETGREPIIGNYVSYDEQNLTEEQQLQARENIGAGVPQVQSDWLQDDETQINYIKNKPDIATDDEIIDMLIQEDMVVAMMDADGSILSDENGDILTW